MKVIIQNVVGQDFLGADGSWVATKDGAKDFCTLLRAYNFAQANTSVRFRVLLHCPEDGYAAAIVEGIGKASAKSPDEAPAPVVIKHQAVNRWQMTAYLPEGFDAGRIHLN